VHLGGVRSRVDRIEYVLVEFRSEVPGESMDFAVLLLHFKVVHRVILQVARLILVQTLQVWVVGVGEMSESKHFLGILAARVSGVVNLDHVGQLERIILLAREHSARDSLLGVEEHFVPEDLA